MQTLSFHVTTNNDILFVTTPTTSATGVLSFEPMPGTFGNAELSISLMDDSGTENGGVDTLEVHSFFIIIESSVVKLLLLNSSGAGIAGVTAQYQQDGDLPPI